MCIRDRCLVLVSFEEGAESLAQELGQVELATRGDVVHPTRYYVQPPHSNYRMGDLLTTPSSTEENAHERFFVILTPSCDLVLRSGSMKADLVVLSECLPLGSFKEYQDWKSKSNSKNRELLRKLLTSRPKGQEDRYFYLPCLLYTSPSPRDRTRSRMPSSA